MPGKHVHDEPWMPQTEAKHICNVCSMFGPEKKVLNEFNFYTPASSTVIPRCAMRWLVVNWDAIVCSQSASFTIMFQPRYGCCRVNCLCFSASVAPGLINTPFSSR